jgi:hypothetical protein
MVLEKRKKKFHAKSGTKRSLFRLLLRLLHAMLDVFLIVCLVVFSVAWLVSNDWDSLMSLWKKSCVVFVIWNHFCGFLLDALFGLTWRMLTTCLTLIKSPYSLYDHLVFDLWYHFMLRFMMFCRYAWLWPLLLSYLVAPSLLLAFVLYWVWALLVHATPKNQVIPMCPPYIPISNLLFQVHLTCFYLSFKLNSFWCYVKISQ